MKKIIIVLVMFLTILLTGCGNIMKNEIYNKTYDVNVDITSIGDVFVPAIERATEATLGVNTYCREFGFGVSNWQLEASGSCVVYEAKALLNNGAIVDYSEVLESDIVVEYQYKAITNAHVIDIDATKLKYTVYEGDGNNEIEAKLIGKDFIIDIALLSFSDSKLIVPIKFADSDSIKKGQIVLAVGNPNGVEYYSTATMGIISFPKRYVVENGKTVEYIQHDAAINPGNSGGALVNVNGELIGINTAKIVDDEIDSIGFAVPSNTVLNIIQRID